MIVELVDGIEMREQDPAASDVLHGGDLHAVVPDELADHAPAPLQPLGNARLRIAPGPDEGLQSHPHLEEGIGERRPIRLDDLNRSLELLQLPWREGEV